MQEIQSMAGELLVNVALGLLSLLAAYALYYIRAGAAKLKAQTARLEDEGARALLTAALCDVSELAERTVSATEQTTAKALREAVKRGEVDRKQLLALGTAVFEEIKGSIAPEAQGVITKNLGSFDEYLRKCIEDAVRRVKDGG